MKLQLKDSSLIQTCSIETLEKVFSINYVNTLEYADWRIERSLKKKCFMAQKKGKIGHSAVWLGSLHSKHMAEHRLPNITISWINEQKGYGVFANEKLNPWSFMGEYTGLVRYRRLFFPLINDYCFMFPRQWLNFRPLTIDSEKYGNFTRFINHSDYPNLESLAIFHDGMMHIIFRTIKEIFPGEELTYDYGNIYWKKRTKIAEKASE